MPLYEYRCKQCSHHFEKIQNFSAEPERVCPKCQGELYRPLTAPALQFKGAGWYINDYAAKPSATSTDSSTSASPSTTPVVESTPATPAAPATESAASAPIAPATTPATTTTSS